MVQSGSFLGRFLGTVLPKLIKPAISLGKNILAPLALSAAMKAADAGIQKKKNTWLWTFSTNNNNIF